ncbi:MAG: lysophospholipid acyltransferase family protein [Candidatus Alcyoniella australis]|nr:lysophospholipid acyltransferase family protein [Candidatus Alcyoniella australis]
MSSTPSTSTSAPQAFPWPPHKVLEYSLANTRQVRLRGNYATRLGVWLMLRLVRGLSWNCAYRLGSMIGRLLGLLRIRRSVAMTNLDIVYGQTKTAAQKKKIYRDSLLNVGRQMVNYLRIPLMDDKFWDECFDLENEHILRDAYNQGRGVIFLYMHFGPWELPGGKISRAGYPLAVVAKRLKNPVVDKLMIDARSAMNLGTIFHRDAMDRIRSGLKSGEGIIMVIDQNMKRSQGVFVDWLGRSASTVRSTAWIARETGAPVITGYAVQTGPKRFKMVMTEQIDWQSHPDPDQELIVNTQRYVGALEKRIYQMPEQWFWLHRRWKVQPEGVANPYDKPSNSSVS